MAVTMIARIEFDKLKPGMDENLNGRLNQFTSGTCFREKFGEKGSSSPPTRQIHGSLRLPGIQPYGQSIKTNGVIQDQRKMSWHKQSAAEEGRLSMRFPSSLPPFHIVESFRSFFNCSHMPHKALGQSRPSSQARLHPLGLLIDAIVHTYRAQQALLPML